MASNTNTGAPIGTSTGAPVGTSTGHTTGQTAGQSTGDKIKGAVGAVHGAGEALRGTVNAGVDEAFGSKQGAAKNEAVADRGLASVEDGKLRRADHEEARLGRATGMDVAHTSRNV